MTKNMLSGNTKNNTYEKNVIFHYPVKKVCVRSESASYRSLEQTTSAMMKPYDKVELRHSMFEREDRNMY